MPRQRQKSILHEACSVFLTLYVYGGREGGMQCLLVTYRPPLIALFLHALT